MRTLCLLGASGSIGQQTIDVIKRNRQDFCLVGFSLGHRTRKISGIIKSFPSIKGICVKSKEAFSYYSKKYSSIKFFYGDEGINELISYVNAEMVVNALVGFVGLKPTLTALKENRIVCLANKESLVVGGELINDLLSNGHGKLYPIDSEHVALSKCLAVDNKDVKKLILTASGGAFRKLNRQELVDVTPENALRHPTWKMGAKITIDCATMINKCFEVIEACYLFNYPVKKIDILLHDESMIHSLVEYNDGSYRLDYGKPDMRIPIKYALYEGRTDFKTIYTHDYHLLGNYHFHDFCLDRYPLVSFAQEVINKKGTYGTVLNAANEEAVHAFLNHQIKFLEIEKIVFSFMKKHHNIKKPTYEDIVRIDHLVRCEVRKYIQERN